MLEIGALQLVYGRSHRVVHNANLVIACVHIFGEREDGQAATSARENCDTLGLRTIVVDGRQHPIDEARPLVEVLREEDLGASVKLEMQGREAAIIAEISVAVIVVRIGLVVGGYDVQGCPVGVSKKNLQREVVDTSRGATRAGDDCRFTLRAAHEREVLIPRREVARPGLVMPDDAKEEGVRRHGDPEVAQLLGEHRARDPEVGGRVEEDLVLVVGVPEPALPNCRGPRCPDGRQLVEVARQQQARTTASGLPQLCDEVEVNVAQLRKLVDDDEVILCH